MTLEAGKLTYTADPGYVGPISFDYVLCDDAPGLSVAEGDCSARTVQMTVTPEGEVVEELHPSPIDPTVPTSLYAATAFLYTDADPLQRDVAPGTIERRRAAVVRGVVRRPDGQPLGDVRIAVKDHPEFGFTTTRTSGTFDLAVNGGGPLTITYDKVGSNRAQRQVEVPWGDYAWAPEVTLVPRAASPAPGVTVAARSSLVPVRASEYGVDDGDHSSMPALPPGDAGEGYAVELWADDAQRPPAATVSVGPGAHHYVRNSTGRRVGEALPLRSYDWARGVWVPEGTGRVVAVLGVKEGVALLDADGDGERDFDDAVLLGSSGVTEGELRELAARYPAGTTLWRLPISHLGTWAWWAERSPADGAALAQPGPARVRGAGGLAAVAAQEKRDVAGTPLSLRSAPTTSATRTLAVPVTGSQPLAGLEEIEVAVSVAGSRHVTRLPAGIDQTYEYVWNGLDGYGRAVQGTFPATVEVTYISSHGRSTKVAGTVPLKSLDTAGQGLGGWTLDAHQVLDVEANRVYGGDGSERTLRADRLQREVESAAGRLIDDVAAGPDGSIYVAAGNQVRRIAPDGTASVVAGSGQWGFGGDGGLGAKASFRGARAIALGADGAVWILDRWNNRVRRVGRDGLIATVAGDGTPAGLDRPQDLAVDEDGSLFILDGRGRVLHVRTDGEVETVAMLEQPSQSAPASLAVGSDGTVLVTDAGGGTAGIVRVGAGGSVTRVAGGPEATGGDGGPARNARLSAPTALAVAGDGTVYFVDAGRIRRIDRSGNIWTVVRPPAAAPPADGDQTGEALAFRSLAVGSDGVVHVATAEGLFRWGASEQTRDGSGQMRVPSGSGDEVFVFDATGRHLRTLDAATGAMRYEFSYDDRGWLDRIALAGTGSARIERDPSGTALSIVAPDGRRTAVAPKLATRVLASDPMLGIPAAVLKAYGDAAAAARSRFACDMRWPILAAIGKTESGHAASGGAKVNARGDVSPRIVGIPLDGRLGTERILDTDDGRFDNDTVFDRAVGPMQFIPSTWRSVGMDGNGDGLADPHNVFDAALAAARYLCNAAPPGNLSERDQLAKAIFSYNHSSSYVAAILADVDFYDSFALASTGTGMLAGGYALPIDRSFIDRNPSMLSWPHHDYPAVDLAVPVGSRVYAVAGGTVISVTSGGRCGNGVIIDANDGYRYTYCHASSVVVATGAVVPAGQLIMLSGNTGNSSGPHLHLQIAGAQGVLLCPQPLLRAWYRGQAASPHSAPTGGCTS